MKYHKIKQALGHTCRNCLNEQLHLSLEPEDCYYFMYPAVCSRCGEVKNIVDGVRFWKRMEIRLKH